MLAGPRSARASARAGHRAGAATPGATNGSATSRLSEWIEYQIDLCERSLLFLDTQRERADDMLAHARAGMPPLLDFDYETLLDARRFERPANYALLRITRAGDACLHDCVDVHKPPVVVVDPRAGHGPGIGGFKRESEVGIALQQGHPVYFVIFFPEPCPGQTLADVLHALRRFVDEVARRHRGLRPILYGNCQAGWAVALLAADCEGLAGPAVLNGSPLSYWAGEPGINPMCVAGGLLGGVRLAHFLADLGDGRFDGAWLDENFEQLKPEAVWDKYATLLRHVDEQRERFLSFERWWGGFYFLSREEILAIVDNLFVGNRLEEGTLRICPGCHVDLRRIRSPLVIFASRGDHITPPQQALGWLSAVYADTAALKQAGQRIVYLINDRIGHLGLFVSAAVARREHRAIVDSLPAIDSLVPGLYEMHIDDRTGEPGCGEPGYRVRFEEREIEDVTFPVARREFERARRASELYDSAYRAFLSPWVQASASPWSAAAWQWLHPMRTSRYLFSPTFNPCMAGVRMLATAVAAQRRPLPGSHPFVRLERESCDEAMGMIAAARKWRDALYEHTFSLLYGA